MSAINGDKARFNRDRKAKIARRARKNKRLADLKQQSTTTGPVARSAQASE